MEGLTDKQVSVRIAQGKVNHSLRKNHTTISKIVLKNTFTIFNLVNLILALMIILVGSYKNLLFVFIALANTLISIINEIRAKRTVDKLRLISEKQPTVIRGGKTFQIPADQLVEGDLIVYSLGDQILTDSVVKSGSAEVNESFITGEQESVEKKTGDKLISGSFIVAGTCQAETVAVGAKSELAKLEESAHSIKTTNSKLFTLMNNIVKYISFTLIPIGALVLWSRFRVNDGDTITAVTSTVASLINMIPEGLILLTSTVLALATIRLSKRQVLVQDLYSTETLARVNCIALDKTGTLTTGRMKVKALVPYHTKSENTLINALKLILSANPADNATSSALREKLLGGTKYEPTEQIAETIPFSSDRKYSGVITKKATYLMGAPEFLGVTPPETNDVYRTIAVVKRTKKASAQTVLGFVHLEDELRNDASKIINYFYKNDIAVKIISGDNLATVQKIAKQAGVNAYDQATDLSTYDSPKYDQLAQDYTIFARVKPNEKKALIKALKKQGHTVAMTGDGVNDILAMKEADVSIAIGDGADAARRSAKIVLLNSGYEAVPSIIDEGRQSINNLERSTALFLAKTVYASILAVIFIFAPIKYPFSSPVEMSLLNFACIGLPGLILATEVNTSRIKNRFARNITEYSVPVGLTISISLFILSLLSYNAVFPQEDLSTIAVFVTFSINLLLIYLISKPLNTLRLSLLIAIVVIVIGAFLVPFTHHFFDFVFLSSAGLITLLIAIVSSAILLVLLKSIMQKISSRLYDQTDV